jgi:hypothetical protein
MLLISDLYWRKNPRSADILRTKSAGVARRMESVVLPRTWRVPHAIAAARSVASSPAAFLLAIREVAEQWEREAKPCLPRFSVPLAPKTPHLVLRKT